MVSGISGTNSYISQMNIQSMQQKMFSKADSDSDGGVNQTEFEAFIVELSDKTGVSVDAEEALSTYDADGDGTLNQDEMDTFMQENAPAPPSADSAASGGMGMLSPEEMFSDTDTDGDGGIDQTELEAFAATMSSATGTTLDVEDAVSTYDTDGDGVLNQDEMDTFMKENAPAPPSADSAASGGMMGPPPGMASPEEMFSDTDTNGDGGIDQSELETFAATMSSATGTTLDVEDAVSTYDTDGDGVLNQDEMDTFMQENAPASSSGLMQQAISAYEMGSDQPSSFADLLNQTTTGSTTGDALDLQNEYIAKMMESYGGQYTYSPLDIKV